ncbi:MAG: biotin/lipoyl-containing protein [Spirochaetota bacterium]
MRRYLVRHENQTLPFVVAEDAVYAAEFPQGETKKPYTWNLTSVRETSAQVEVDGLSHTAHYIVSDNVVLIALEGFFYRLPYTAQRQAQDAAGGAQAVRAEIPGRIVKVLVRPGEAVMQNQALIVQEAMKMEITLRAPGNLVVASVQVSEGAQVEAEAILVTFENSESGKRS